MSEEQREPSQPTGQHAEQSLLPPASHESPSAALPYWAPPPPAPARPVDYCLWLRLAAAVVLAAIIAAAAGAGVGWSLARTINSHTGTAQTITTPGTTPGTTQPSTNPEAPLTPTNPSTGSLNADAIAAKINPAIVDINTVVGSGQAAGTGMIISSNGEILTNNHVVDGSTSIQVTIAGHSQTYTAHLIAADPSADIAVIKVDGLSGLPTVSFASSAAINVGDAVVAIGNALGQGGTPSVSQGSITALDQTITASSGGSTSEQLTGMIQSDATIYPGDSGGPLVNSAGQVIGMITAGNVSGFRSSASNVNYAIASDNLLSVVNQIRSGQTSPQIIYGQVGFIGVSVQTLDAATASQLGLNVSSGALVATVQPGSPAAGAGIARYSVITAVGSSPVTSSDTLGTAIRSHKPGERVSVTWVNTSGTHTATLTLAGVNP
jgi:S1-C subfamily serine protease